MKTIYKILSLCFLVLLITNCSPKDNYDWKSVDPGKQTITRIDSVKGNYVVLVQDTIRGNNATIYDYMAIPRGGSVFTWTSLTNILTIENDSKYDYITHIKAKTEKDSIIKLFLTETTWGGKTSKDTVNLFVQGFCPFDINQLIGSGKYSCSEMNYVPFDVNFTIQTNNSIEIDNFSNNGWSIIYNLSGDINETIKIADNHFDFNGEPVIVKGSGTYNTCNGKIVVNFAVVRPTGDTVLLSDNTVYAGTDKFIQK